jgi:hypothetical protein
MTKNTTQTEIEKIAAIFLDGRAVKYPVSFNEEEGWVEMQVPVQMSEGVAFKSGGNASDEEQDIAQFHWQTVRKEGKVKVLYAD